MGGDGDWLKKYHEEHANYGGACHEFHARAQTWIATRDAEIAGLRAEVERHKRESVALAAALHEHEERHGVEKLITGHIEAATINQRHEVGMLLGEIAALKGEVAELKGFLAEIAELVGPGGDDSPFGRVESALVGLTGRLDDALADLAAHKRALAAGPAALRAIAAHAPGPASRAAEIVEAAQAAAMKDDDKKGGG